MLKDILIDLYRHGAGIKYFYKVEAVMKKIKKLGRYPIIITMNLWLFLPGVQSDNRPDVITILNISGNIIEMKR